MSAVPVPVSGWRDVYIDAYPRTYDLTSLDLTNDRKVPTTLPPRSLKSSAELGLPKDDAWKQTADLDRFLISDNFEPPIFSLVSCPDAYILQFSKRTSILIL